MFSKTKQNIYILAVQNDVRMCWVFLDFFQPYFFLPQFFVFVLNQSEAFMLLKKKTAQKNIPFEQKMAQMLA